MAKTVKTKKDTNNILKYKEYDRLVNKNTNIQYRILSVFDGNIITCQIGTPTLSVFYFLESEIETGLADGTYTIEKDEFQVVDPDLYFTNANSEVKQKQIERFHAYKTVCSAVYDEYKYRLYELTVQRKSKDTVKALCAEYDISRQTFWKYFNRYLQSGLQDIALTDQRGKIKKSQENRSYRCRSKKIPEAHEKIPEK